MKIKNITFIFILLMISILSKIYSHHSIPQSSSIVMMISISSDGHYAISSHLDGKIILWNIANHTKKIIAAHANIYSAYFIKHTDCYMWQDQNNIVNVQNIKGKKLFEFQNNFPVYGQVMSSDFKKYFASDRYWNLYQGIGVKQRIIKHAYGIDGFLCSGKLLNLTMSDNNHYLITAGDAEHIYDDIPLSAATNSKSAALQKYNVGLLNTSLLEGVVIWNTDTGKPLFKLPGNEVKTYATISPDNNYVISGDENEFLLAWNAHNGKQYYTVSNYGIDVPQDINDPLLKNHVNAILTIKFIDNNNDYLRFNYRMFNYVMLYNVNSSKSLQYLSLGKLTLPSVNNFLRNESIDTAPDVNMLVIGQADDDGIIVYRYNIQTHFLQKIW